MVRSCAMKTEKIIRGSLLILFDHIHMYTINVSAWSKLISNRYKTKTSQLSLINYFQVGEDVIIC